MPQKYHSMLVETTHDEKCYQTFSSTFKSHLSATISPNVKRAYSKRVMPEFERKNMRPVENRHEIRKSIASDHLYQMSSSLKRTAQEIMFDGVGECIERQLEMLIVKARSMHNKQSTLRTNKKLKIPLYHSAVDIHCMPGAYHRELCDSDVYAGALYDRSIYLFSMGLRGELNDDIGQSLAKWVKMTYPDFIPTRILDMACSVGHGTLPWTEAYSNAEIHAIDIGAPMLRYGQARATALGKTVHFSQQNAEKTDYEDSSFDLVISQIMVHETSSLALKRILAECHRLLKPGGLMVHLDGRSWRGLTHYDAFVSDWDTYYNNEPFIGPMHDLIDNNLNAIVRSAGFRNDKIFASSAASASRKTTNKNRKEIASGDFGYVGYFLVFGAWK